MAGGLRDKRNNCFSDDTPTLLMRLSRYLLAATNDINREILSIFVGLELYTNFAFSNVSDVQEAPLMQNLHKNTACGHVFCYLCVAPYLSLGSLNSTETLPQFAEDEFYDEIHLFPLCSRVITTVIPW